MSYKTFIEPTYIIVRNVVVTFLQVAIATWVASGLSTDKVAVSAAIGAGLSAVWNIVVKPVLIHNGYLKG